MLASTPLAPLVAVPYPTSTNPDISTPTYVTLDASGTSQPATSSGPVGYTPTQILSAYGVSQLEVNGSAPTGTGETIAIIDAYNDPTIKTDLITFDQTMGLPAPASFQVISETGSTTNLPEDDPTGWAVEESLDVEWAHAMAPGANIILVEANTNQNSDLDTAVSYAKSLPNVNVISMSYGSSESSGETGSDSYFLTPNGHNGITFVASTGDGGAPGGYPAYSPNVVAAGGTSLTLSGDTYVSESGWSDSGGGISQYETQPSYQSGVVTQSTTKRTIPDFSFDANPNTGVAIIDSYTYGSADPWTEIGGTSVSAPCLSGLISLSDQIRAESGLSSLNGLTQTLPTLYSLPAADFHDITTGNNGYAAGTGYDLVTGIGTPVANLLVPNLAGDTFYVTTTTPAAGSTTATQPTSYTINFNEAINTSSIALSDFAINSQEPTSFSDTSTSITFSFASSPVTSLGQQTMTLSGITSQGTGTTMTALNVTFRYDPHPITVSTFTPTSGSIVTLPMTSVTVNFSEPFATSSISTSNLQLSSGTVTGYSIVNSTTVTYTISGVTSEGSTGQLTVTMAAGAVTDPTGDPSQSAFSSTYDLQAVDEPMPAMAATGGAGSLVYDSQVQGALNYAGQTDTYTTTLDAGETISLVATSSGGLEPTINVQGPGGINTSASAGAPNGSAVIETVTLTASGSYTFSLSGLGNSIGGYTLAAYVNAAVEEEEYGGASNSTLATAQSLAGSFTSLGGSGSRAAVMGALASSADQDWYSFTLAAGDFVTLGAAVSSGSSLSLALLNSSGTVLTTGTAPAATFQQQVSDFGVPTAGTYYVLVTGSGASQYSLMVDRDADFDNQVNNTTSEAQSLAAPVGGSQTVLGSLGYETAQTLNYTTVEPFNAGALSAYTSVTPVDDDATLTSTAAHDGSLGLSLGADTEWLYRDDSGDQVSQGEAVDVWFQAQGTTSGTAYFGFGASAAGTLSLVVATNTNQLLLEDNTGYGFVTLAAVSQVYQPSHWYLLQVDWGTGGQITGSIYDSNGTTLLNTVSATDTSFAATSGGVAFRGVDSDSHGFDFDTVGVSPLTTPTYSETVQVGGTITASATTPDSGAAGIDNLSPELLIYNSSGTLVASDDPGPGGGNPTVSYTVPAGAGGTYYVQLAASPLTSQPTEGDYTLTIQNTSVNHAPTLNTSIEPSLPTEAENSTGGLGDSLSNILATMSGGNPISDIDPGAVQGIAVTGANNTDGAWEYSLNGGSTWTAFPQVSADNSLLLPVNASTRIQFVPAAGFSGTVAGALSFDAWDQTEGTVGQTFATLLTGGDTAFSTTTATASLVVTAVNAAPVLMGANALSAQLENNNASPGTLVSALVSGQISDPGVAASGIAITGVNTANGTWQYSTSGSAGPWISIPAVSSTSALDLAADANTMVRFVPNSGYTGTLTAALSFRAWNQTDGATNGSLVNPGAGGGVSAYSTASASASLAVAPLGDTRSWIGGGPDNNWSDGANWIGGVAPSANDSIIFPAAALGYTSVDDFPAGTQFSSITIAGSGYAISGNGVTLLNGFVDSSSGSDSFSAPITLAASQTIINGNSTSTLTLGNIDTGNLLTLTFDGSGTTNVTGVISDSGGVTKMGAGTVVLSGANTYLGITNVNQGVLVADNNSALGSAAAGTTVATGTSLEVEGNVTIAEPITIGGDGIGAGVPGQGLPYSGLGALRSTSGSNFWTGPITVNGTAFIGVDAGSELNASGSITSLAGVGFISVEKVGGGQLDFTGSSPNDITGSTAVLQGTLYLDKTSGSAIQGALSVGDSIEGSQESVARLGANNQIPQVDPTGGSLLSVTVNPSGLLDFNGYNDTIGNLTVVAGQTYSAAITTGSGMLTLGGTLTASETTGASEVSPPATISGNLNLGTLNSFSGGTSAITSRTFAINAASGRGDEESTLTISAVISGSSAISLLKSGPGTLTLTGANTYSGTTIISQGLTEIGNSSAFGTGTLELAGGVLDAVAGAQTVANTVEIDSNAQFWGTNNITFAGPATMNGSRNFYVLDASQTVTFSGGIGEGVFNGSSLTKNGPGTLALTGANTYSGTTNIEPGGGTLDLSASGTLLNSSGFVIYGGTLMLDNSAGYVSTRISGLATISLEGGTLDFVGAANTASSESIGAVTIFPNYTSTIESDQGAGGTAALTLASLTTSPTATVSFIGTGSPLSATGSNQINIAVSPGSLTNGILPYATVIGPSTLDLATYVSNSTGVAITALPAADYVTSLAAAGPNSNVKLTSPGTYVSNGASINALLVDGTGITVGSANDSLTVGSGQVVFAGGGTNTVAVGRLSLDGQAFITADNGSTATISSVVIAGSPIKAGNGTVVLTGSNQISGAYINQGVLDIENSAALGATSSTVTVNSGATLALQDPGGSPVNVGPMSLILTGTGYNNMGAIDNLSGNSNSWAGTVVLDGVSIDSTSVLSDQGTALMTPTFLGSTSGQLSLSGVISGSAQIVKVGAGTVALGGVASNTDAGTTIIEQGTLLLDKAAGLNALDSGTIYVGNDQANTSPGELELGANNQIPNGTSITVNSTGILNFNGYSEAIGSLTLTIGPNGGSSVATGSGTLTLGGGINVNTIGAGNPTAATISGNLALNPFTATSAVTRTFTVSHGTTGTDLIISAAISDGNGLYSSGIIMAGLGTTQFAGSAANTYTGTTTVDSGTLQLNKTPGADAMMGPLVIGDDQLATGGENSAVVRWLASGQLNGSVNATVYNTGLMDLNGFSDTVGTVADTVGLTINGGNVTTGTGTLTLAGDVSETTNNLNTTNIFTPGTISGNLNLGSAARTFTINHLSNLPYDLIISANISGAAGVDLNKAGAGNLLLAGNNTYAGNTFLSATSAGEIAIGSSTALGTGILYLGSDTLLADSGSQTISNTVYLAGTAVLAGANSITFSGPANLTASSTINVTNPMDATFSGGIGETETSYGLTKMGAGFLFLTGLNTYDGPTVVNGGWLVLKDGGTAVNSSSFTVNANATLRIDNNSAENLSGRISPTAAITVDGGTLLFIGAGGAASSLTAATLNIGGSAASTVISQVGPGSGASVALSFGQLNRTQLGFVQFVGAGVSLGTTTNQLSFGTVTPGESGTGSNAIVPYATVLSSAGQVDLATLSGTDLVAFTNYATGNINSAAAGSVYLLDGDLSSSPQTLASSLSLNAVLIRGSGLTLTGNSGVTLTLAGGELVSAGGAGNTFSVPNLALGSTEGVFDTATSLTVSSSITGSSNIGVVKAGAGTLTLSGASPSTYTGQTIIAQGVVNLQQTGSLGAGGAANSVETVTATNVLSFELYFNGATTASIPAGAPAATVQSDLDALGTIGGVGGSVTVTNPSPSGTSTTYTVTFGGTLAGIAEPELSYSIYYYTTGATASMSFGVINSGGLAGNGVTVEPGAALELAGGATETGQQLTLNGTGIDSSGALLGDGNSNTWNGPVVVASSSIVNVAAGGTLTVAGAVSGTSSLTEIGTGTLEYTGANPNTLTAATTVDQGTLVLDKTAGVPAIDGALVIGNDVGAGLETVQVDTAEQILTTAAVTINSTGVLQTLASVATSTTQAEQTVTVAGSSGDFQLTFNSDATATIPFNATPATVQSDLQALADIGSGNVSVTGTPGNYVVLFTGALANTAQNTLQISVVSGSSIGTNAVKVISAGGELGQEQIGALTMDPGISSSASISLATGTTLDLNGNVTVNTGVAGASSASPSVTIAGGTLNGCPPGLGTNRTFTVNQGPEAVDLLVTSTLAMNSSSGTSLTKAGTGRMALDPTSGSNSLAGSLTVSSGELTLQQSGALTGATSISVTSGAAIEVATSITTTATFTLNGTGINNTGALVDTSGNDTWTGNIAVGATTTSTNVGVSAGYTLTISGVISGTGSLTKILPGSLVLAGSTANTNTGTTTVAEGSLLLSKPQGIDAIASGGSLVVGNDSGGADSDLVQLTASSEIDANDSVTIDSTGQFDLNGFSQSLTGITMEFGPTQSGLLTTESGTLTLSGSATFNSVGTLGMGSPAATISGNLALTSAAHTFTVNPGNSVDNALISATITGTGTVTKSGVGTLAISANNTGWSSPITLSGGTVDLGNSGALGTGRLTVSSNTTLRGDGTAITLANNITMNNPFTIGGTQNFTLNDTVTGNSTTGYTIFVTNAGATSIGNVTTSSVTLYINTNFYSNATLAGTLSGTGNFEKTGLGQLTIGPTGSINLTTNVYIFAGVLAVSESSAINSSANIEPSSGGALAISGGQTFSNKLTLYNSSSTDSGSNGFLTGALVSTSGTNIWSGNIVLYGSVAGTNYIGVDSGTLTISGTISQSITGSGLAKVGAGTLVLGGTSSNTYTGATTVEQGTLLLNKSGTANAIGSGGAIVGDGGGGQNADVLQIGTLGNAEIPSTDTVTIGSTGLLDLASYSATATITELYMSMAPVASAAVETGGGVLTLASGGYVTVNSSGATDANSPAATISGYVDLAGSAAFTVSPTLVASSVDDLVVSAYMFGGGSGLTITGGGTMALTGANDYSGTTALQSGSTLALSASGTDPNTQMSIQSGSTLLIDNQSAGALNNRLGSSVSVSLNGGTFDYLGAPGAASTESIGALFISGTDGLFESTVSATAGSSVTITAASLNPSSGTGIFRFDGIGANLGSASNQLLFNSAPSLTNGIIPNTVLEDSSGVDFASYGASGIAPASYVTSLAGAGATSNVILSSNQTLGSSQTVNAILFASSNVSVNVGSNTLSLVSGAVAAEGTGDAINGGTLALWNEGAFDVETGDSLAVSSGITGSYGLIKSGSGTLTLSGGNSYTGETYINAGVLNVQNSSALGSSSNTTNVASGAGLQLQGNISPAGSLVLAGTGPGSNGAGALQNLSGTNTWVGSVTASAGGNLGIASGQLTLDGAVASSGLVQVGTGILQLAGSAADSNLKFTVDSGTLELNDSGGSAINGLLLVGDDVGGSGAAMVVAMQASQFSAAASIVVQNSGTVDLAGYSQSLSSLQIDDGSLINSGSGGTLTLTGGIFPLGFIGGSLNTGSGTLAITGTNSTVSVNVADPAVIAGNLDLVSGTTTFSVADGPALDDLSISATITGSGSIAKSGAGTLLLSGNNAGYSGGTSSSTGTLALGNANALGSGSLTIGGGTLRGDGGNVTISNPVIVTGSFTLGSEGDLAGINTGITLAGNVSLDANATITVTDPQVSAAITGNIGGAYAITKAGDGTLGLSGASSSYSGTTTVSAGVLNLQSSGALGATTGVAVSSGAAIQLQGSLSIGNVPLTLAGTGFVGSVFGTGEGTGAIENVSGASVWGTGVTAVTLGAATSLGSDLGSLTLDGTLTASNAVNKVGLGTIQLAGTASNALTGTVIVNDGVLQLNKSSGVDAIESNLIIGDNQGTGTDTVQELAAEQVLDSTSVGVTVNSTGLWDLTEVPTADFSSAQQTILISGIATGGTYTLTYNGQTTGSIAYDASAATVQSDLQALANIGSGNVSVAASTSATFVVTFTGSLANMPIATLSSTSSLTGDASTLPSIGIYTSVAGGISQMISGSATATSASNLALSLVVGATTSAAVNTGSGALALDGSYATAVGDGNIGVTTRPGITTAVPATISGNLVLDAGSLSGPLAVTRTIYAAASPGASALVISATISDGVLQSNLTIDATEKAAVVFSGTNSYSGLTTVSTGALNVQNSAALGATVDNSVSAVAFVGATSGSFTLSFGGYSTGSLAINSSAATVQNALANLASIGTGNILVTQVPGTIDYDFIFQGSLAGVSESDITVSSFTESGATLVSSGQTSSGGVTGAETTVSAGASLELQGNVAIGAEQLQLTGVGLMGSGGTAMAATNAGSGALLSVSGSNSWSGNIVLGLTTAAPVGSMGVTSGQLTLSGVISGGGVGYALGYNFAKLGAGTLVYSGNAGNVYNATTYINGGTLLINKSSGTASYGSYVVGDNVGGAAGQVLQLGPNVTSGELVFFSPTAPSVYVESTGLLDLATYGATDYAPLATMVGPTTSAEVVTGSGAVDTNFIYSIALAGTSAASPAATISGNVTAATTVVYSFNIDRSGATDDLNILADIGGGDALNKLGWGTLDFSSTNSYTATTTIEQGTLVVQANGALGAGSGATIVDAGATLALRGGVDYTAAESVTINSAGVTFPGALTHNGAIDSLGGANTFGGTINLGSASSIGVTTGSLTLAGPISGSYPLTVNGFGTLIAIGGISATSTTVNNTALIASGTVSGPVTLANAGAFEPGTSLSTPGSVSTGALTLNSSGAFAFVLDGSTAGSGYSQDNVSGAVNLAGATLQGSLAFVPSAGESFTLITSSSPVQGTFNNLPEGSQVSVDGIGFTVEYNDGGDNVVLVANNAPTISGSALLPMVINASSIANNGMSIPALIASGLSITDSNSGAVQGIAVDGVNDTNGTWQYSTNGGTSWTAFSSPTDIDAVLLADNSNTLVRFVPNAGYSGQVSGGLTFRAWDQTSGTDGGTADASNNGASTPFSSAIASASVSVDAPPTIVGAYVSGTSWSSTYLGVLAAAGVGSSTLGFEFGSGSGQLTTTVPWTNANEISIAFSEPVNVSQASLTLLNGSNTAASIATFSYNSSTYVATWQFSSSLATGEYLINLAGNSVTDADGTQLDGAWTTNASTFSAGSGSGTPGSDFNFYFNVLPGDANKDGQVNGTDLLFMKLDAGAPVSASNYRYDLQGAASISSSYILTEKLNAGLNTSFFTQPNEPAQSAFASAASDPSFTSASSGGQTSPTVIVLSPAPGYAGTTIASAAGASPLSDLAASDPDSNAVQVENFPAAAPPSTESEIALAPSSAAAGTPLVSIALVQSGAPTSPLVATEPELVVLPTSTIEVASSAIAWAIQPAATAADSQAIDAALGDLAPASASTAQAAPASGSTLPGSPATVPSQASGSSALAAVFGLFGDEQDLPATVSPLVSTGSAWSPVANSAQAAWASGVSPAAAVITPKLAATIHSADETAELASVHWKLFQTGRKPLAGP